MLIEPEWLNTLVDTSENKVYFLEAGQERFGHSRIVIIVDCDIYYGATTPSGQGPSHCLGFMMTIRHTHTR
jgi:hypothetical protein